MTFRTISNSEETNLFLNKIENFSRVRLPYNYAKNSKIVGVFVHNKLVAGYMLVTKPGYRSLLFVPDETKKSNSFFSKDEYEMMEVNGLWIGPAIKTPLMQYKIWIRLIIDIFLARKKYLLLMSDVRNKNIEYLHSLAEPEILYEGAPIVMAGEKTHPVIRVAFTTRWKAVINIPKYWLELKKREKRAFQSVKQRDFAQI